MEKGQLTNSVDEERLRTESSSGTKERCCPWLSGSCRASAPTLNAVAVVAAGASCGSHQMHRNQCWLLEVEAERPTIRPQNSTGVLMEWVPSKALVVDER